MAEDPELLTALLREARAREAPAPSVPRALPRFPRRLLWFAAGLVALWFLALEPLLDPLAWRLAEAGRTSRVAGHRTEILAAAADAGLDPYLVAGIVYAESSGRIDARSKVDALGLMQLMLPTAREQARKLGLDEPDEVDLLTDAGLNLTLGAHYYLWVLEREGGDPVRALVAYNAGTGRLRGWIKEAGGYAAWLEERRAAGDSQVLAYADKVLAAAERFRERGLLEDPVPPAGPTTAP